MSPRPTAWCIHVIAHGFKLVTCNLEAWTDDQSHCRVLTDKVVPLDGLDHSHVGAGLLLHVQLLHPSQVITPSQVCNEQGICHAVGLHTNVCVCVCHATAEPTQDDIVGTHTTTAQ